MADSEKEGSMPEELKREEEMRGIMNEGYQHFKKNHFYKYLRGSKEREMFEMGWFQALCETYHRLMTPPTSDTGEKEQ